MDETNNRGGQPGNDNAHRGSLVRAAIRRALAENEAKGRDVLLNIVNSMIEKAQEGDKDARKELFDRLDGKPEQNQNTNLSGSLSVNWPLPKSAKEGG